MFNSQKANAQRSPTLKRAILTRARLRKLSLILLILWTLSFSLYQIRQAKSQTLTVGPTGPPQYNYSRIQDAADAAIPGDTIQVAAGTYYEHVIVNQSLTIIGENPQTTIVDGTGNGTIFTLDESNTTIMGFTIRNAGNTHSAISITRDLTAVSTFEIIRNNIISTSLYGIYMSLSDQNTISDNNIIMSNLYGIYMSGSDQNTIAGNTLLNNQFGAIYVNGGNSENITGNNISGSAYGIRGVSSPSNIIIGNTITQTSYAIHLTSASTGNTIQRNIISGENTGIYTSSDSTTADHNTITDGAYGIYYLNCRFGSIYYNNINSSTGIRLYWSSPSASSHNVNNNKIVDSDWAIEITNANGNTLTGNWLQADTYGIYMTGSSNTIYHNNFVNDGMSAYCGGGTNAWDNGSHGNYWSDYPAKYDTNGDGIGEIAYNITAVGKDYHPLIRTWSEHDIGIVSVSASANEVHRGTIVNLTVTIRNNANISVSETFTVTAKYNTTSIKNKAVTNLLQNATQILIFSWNTTGVAPGYYTISAVATAVPDELNTDNACIGGTVRISIEGDANHSGNVDVFDILAVKAHWGETPSSPNWNPAVDVNDDGVIDLFDTLTIKDNWG